MGTGFSWGAEDPAPSRGRRAQVGGGGVSQTSQAGSVYSGGGAYQSSPSYGREQAPQSEYSPPMSSAQYAAETGLQSSSPYGKDRENTKGFGDTGNSCIRFDVIGF